MVWNTKRDKKFHVDCMGTNQGFEVRVQRAASKRKKITKDYPKSEKTTKD